MAVLLIFSSCQQTKYDKKSAIGLPLLSGNYLGQIQPGDSAVIFVPALGMEL